MSQLRKETIECPHCHQEGKFDLWTSVNVDLDPELREKIFSEELFMYHCPHCGKVTGIPAGTLYHDMTHGFMIFFDFSSVRPLPRKYSSTFFCVSNSGLNQ